MPSFRELFPTFSRLLGLSAPAGANVSGARPSVATGSHGEPAALDTSRHEAIFSRAAFGNRRIDVVGAGATGSRVVVELAKLGVENIHVWDFDHVEGHNIANQAYGMDDIGKLKVQALHDLIARQTGTSIVIHPERVDGSQDLGDVVFLMTDTMDSRKLIWKKAIRLKLRTKLMIEGRMGAQEGRIYTINPSRPAQIKGWEAASNYDNGDAEVSACGATISVGPTAGFLAMRAVWQFMRWADLERGNENDELEHEIIFFMRPAAIMSRKFE